MPITALILDFGEVMVRPQSPASMAHMAATARLPVDEFERRYWAERLAYDNGQPAADYWRGVMPGATDDAVAALIEGDYRSWTDYRDDMWTITASFKARGGRTAILSNGVPEIMGRVRDERQLAAYFDVIVVSYELGMSKPEPAIYNVCLERLGVPASDSLFVDDRRVNIDAAARLGLQTLHFTGDASVDELRARLTRIA